MKCPDCGKLMVLKKHKGKTFYGCSNFPKCYATHSAQADGTPLGWPANKETRKARSRAHIYLDSLWKSGDMTRQDAYSILKNITGLNGSQAHIANFTSKQCYEVIDRIKEIQEKKECL